MKNELKPIVRITGSVITLLLYVLSVYIIIKYERGEHYPGDGCAHIVWKAIPGFILHHATGIAIIYSVFRKTGKSMPSSEKSLHFYLRAILSNIVISFIMCFYVCYLGVKFEAAPAYPIWYAIMSFSLNFVIYNQSQEIKINKALLWICNDILFLVSFALQMYVRFW